MPSNVVTYAIAHKKYDMIDYLVEHGCNFAKRGMIDRILKMAGVTNTSWRRSYRQYIRLPKLTELSKLTKLGCTYTSRSSNLMAKYGYFNYVIYFYKKHNIKPNGESVIKYLTALNRWHSKRITSQTIKYINYVNDIMEVKIFDKIESDVSRKIIRNILFSNLKEQDIVNFADYFVEKTGITLELDNFIDILYRGKSLAIVQFFEKHGVIPDKSVLVESLKYCGENIIKYLTEKYNLSITIKDIHNLIAQDWLSLSRLREIIKMTGVKITAHTIGLLVPNNLYRHTLETLRDIVSTVGQITRKSHQEILNHSFEWALDGLTYTITDDPIPDDEVPDGGMPDFRRYDYDTDDDDDYAIDVIAANTNEDLDEHLEDNIEAFLAD
jgi:hypothetical protein